MNWLHVAHMVTRGFFRRCTAALLLALLVSCARCHGDDEKQEVTSLPGQPRVDFKQYTGYITVNESHGRVLFYWFCEASHPNAAQQPLALWLSGGPGCSSTGTGLLGELGPLSTNNSGTGLVLNKNSWTKAANIIFLDSPYGTGFSHTNTTSDYLHLLDDIVAEDSHAFLVGWFKKFPEYIHNDFYLIGESYAGHYVPNLARVIVRQNKSPQGFHINFKGFAVGNPWTDPYSDNLGNMEFSHSHSLISDETYETMKKTCDFQNYLPVNAESSIATCNNAIHEADVDMAKIDIYNVYGLSCNKQNSSSQVGNPWTDPYSDNLGNTEFYHSYSLISDETFETMKKTCDFQNYLPVNAESSIATCNNAIHEADVDMSNIDIYNVYGLSCNKLNSSSQKRWYGKSLLTGAYDSCLDSLTQYLNLPSVQSALHITSPVVWSSCSEAVYLNYSKSNVLQSMIPVYRELLKEDLRIWVYSGDVDGVVSTLGTRKWISKLDLPIEIPWYAWDYKNQVGGWTQKYKGLTFVTVRGAGHFVAAVKPGPALAVFRSFLAGNPLPPF